MPSHPRFYGWDAFSPDQQSFYTLTAAPIIIFWLLVIILVVIAQNIILAVVADSYGAARDELAVRGCSWLQGRCWGVQQVPRGVGGGGGRGAQHGSVWGEWVAVGRALLKRSLPYRGSLLQSAAGQENSDSGTVVLLMDVRGS